MNRVIKFRGKRKDNGEWVEGYYCHNATYGPNDGHLIYEEGLNIWEVDPATVSQYTGRNDDDDKEVFCGYIIRWCEPAPWDEQDSVTLTSEVWYQDACFWVRESGGPTPLCTIPHCRIIGNRRT